MPGNNEKPDKVKNAQRNGDTEALQRMARAAAKSRLENNLLKTTITSLKGESEATDLALRDAKVNVFINESGDVLPAADGPAIDDVELRNRLTEIDEQLRELETRLEEKRQQ